MGVPIGGVSFPGEAFVKSGSWVESGFLHSPSTRFTRSGFGRNDVFFLWVAPVWTWVRPVKVGERRPGLGEGLFPTLRKARRMGHPVGKGGLRRTGSGKQK